MNPSHLFSQQGASARGLETLVIQVYGSWGAHYRLQVIALDRIQDAITRQRLGLLQPMSMALWIAHSFGSCCAKAQNSFSRVSLDVWETN
jgi:hypothetical protein